MSETLEMPTTQRPMSSIQRRMGQTDDAALQRTLDKIEELGLNGHLLQLETLGYTVIPGVLSPDRIERAKAAILRRAEGQVGRKIDPETATSADFQGMAYQHYLIFDDPVFQEILLEPKPLALITYLLGESCVLSSMGSHFRGPGGVPLGVHSDGSANGLMSSVSMVANCNYALTPYSREAGALVMFPASHHKQRQPTPHENWTANGKTMIEIMGKEPAPNDLDTLDWECPKGGVTMNISPGDAVIWHGNTWHGGWRRDIPGVRMNLAAYFCRQHMLPQERRGDTRYPEVFECHANEPRFARLLGEKTFNGWREEGPDFTGNKDSPSGLFD
jgi:hypothetical protein